jgi:hypothetical protein
MVLKTRSAGEVLVIWDLTNDAERIEELAIAFHAEVIYLQGRGMSIIFKL